MTPPQRGSVIRYAYLWADENAAGQEEGQKDRPVLVLAVNPSEGDAPRLLILAITHTPRSDPDDAVIFPDEVKRRAGLDANSAWVVTTEANAFLWAGPDIRPVPDRRPRTVIYGRVPESFLRQVARSYVANRDRQRSRLVRRTE